MNFKLQRLAASCVWLASKLEENPRKPRHVVLVFHRMECRRENLPIQPLDLGSKVCLSNLCYGSFSLSLSLFFLREFSFVYIQLRNFSFQMNI